MTRIVFMGTPEFAVPSLDLLVENGYMPVAVATAPDRKRGRGRKVSSSAVKEAAAHHGITTVLQPETVTDPDFTRQIRNLSADIIVVVAFRILPPEVFREARLGSFNLHGSLLPMYRGAAPIHRAVLDGATETGVTTFFLEQSVDTGNIIMVRRMSIGPDETTGDVHDRMMLLGARVVLETVQKIESGNVTVSPQDDAMATPAPKVYSAEARVRWTRSAAEVHNHIRGMSPFPGAFSIHGSDRLKFYRSRIFSESPQRGTGPGQVLKCDDSLVIACGTGSVEITELQSEGKRRLESRAFLAGSSLELGEVLE